MAPRTTNCDRMKCIPRPANHLLLLHTQGERKKGFFELRGGVFWTFRTWCGWLAAAEAIKTLPFLSESNAVDRSPSFSRKTYHIMGHFLKERLINVFRIRSWKPGRKHCTKVIKSFASALPKRNAWLSFFLRGSVLFWNSFYVKNLDSCWNDNKHFDRHQRICSSLESFVW